MMCFVVVSHGLLAPPAFPRTLRLLLLALKVLEKLKVLKPRVFLQKVPEQCKCAYTMTISRQTAGAPCFVVRACGVCFVICVSAKFFIMRVLTHRNEIA
jgi:hypothetical protein